MRASGTTANRRSTSDLILSINYGPANSECHIDAKKDRVNRDRQLCRRAAVERRGQKNADQAHVHQAEEHVGPLLHLLRCT